MNERYYLPTKDKSLSRLVDDARRRNVKRDLRDHSEGFAAPGDGGMSDHLRTAISAIVSGLETCDDIDQDSAKCIAEGIAMIQDVELELRKFLAMAEEHGGLELRKQRTN